MLVAVEVAALGPKPVTHSRRGAAGPAGALVGRGSADLLDEQRAEAALGVESGDAGQAAVDDVRMPSMVIEVSATLVATTILRQSLPAKARS